MNRDATSAVDDLIAEHLLKVVLGRNHQGEEVFALSRRSDAESLDEGVEIADYAQVDVSGGTRTLEPKFECHATLEDHAVAERVIDSRQKAFEQHELQRSIEVAFVLLACVRIFSLRDCSKARGHGEKDTR